jgi:hypothetical protein
MNENYRSSIEDLFQPILESMKAGDLTFFDDPHKSAHSITACQCNTPAQTI